MPKDEPETVLKLDQRSTYIESRDGGYYVAGAPISLEAIIHQFKDGLSPETIQRECFPALRLEQVYGVCTYYLGHREEVDKYLEEAARDFDRLAAEVDEQYPGLLHGRENLRQLRERAGKMQLK